MLYRLDDQRSLSLETGNSAAPRTCIETDRIEYGTLTNADVLLLRLTETYDQLEARTGVKPLVIAQDSAFQMERRFARRPRSSKMIENVPSRIRSRN